MAPAAELCRRRPCRLVIAAPVPALAAYLSRAERPLAALLARERLRVLGADRFTYHSRPLSLLGLALVPQLTLEARWGEEGLAVRSLACRIEGLGRWGQDIGVTLEAGLRPGDEGLEGWVRLCLRSPLLAAGWLRAPAGRAMDQQLDRIERRLQRGLHTDLQIWLARSGWAR
jgi:hypothetical protein